MTRTVGRDKSLRAKGAGQALKAKQGTTIWPHRKAGPGPGRTSDHAEIARIVLRGAIGGTMIAHGVRHGRSLEGTAGWFESIGFREPKAQAAASAAVEVGSGAAVVAGMVTPVATSAVVGTMAVAYKAVHEPNGFFVVAEGWEYVAFIGASCVALSALGSGRFSLDSALGIQNLGTPLSRGLVTAGLGVAGAAAQLRLFWKRPKN